MRTSSRVSGQSLSSRGGGQLVDDVHAFHNAAKHRVLPSKCGAPPSVAYAWAWAAVIHAAVALHLAQLLRANLAAGDDVEIVA